MTDEKKILDLVCVLVKNDPSKANLDLLTAAWEVYLISTAEEAGIAAAEAAAHDNGHRMPPGCG